MSFPRYPKYKNSGVEWLGEVPEHWEVKPLRRLVEETNAGEVIDKTHWGGNSEILYTCALNPLDCDYEGFPDRKRTTRNDLLLTRNGTPYVHKPVVNAIYTNVVQRIKLLTGVNRDYLATALQNSADNLKGYGVSIESLNYDMWKALPIVIPTIHEQTAIAAFLDRETGKIDALIAEQRRLIELLQEKRQAVISHAVTKGLNPAAPMKDSGIEWLGEVPEHWKVTRLAYNAAIENGTTPSRDNPGYWFGGDVPWLSSGEVNQYRITEASESITEKALDECSLRLLPRGTVVIGMIGQGKTRGLSASLEIEASINQNLAAIVPGKNLASDYLLYIFQSVYDYLREFGRGGNQAALNCEILSALKVPLPPLEEQLKICDYLGDRLKEFDTLTAEAQRAIELLQERRAALISAAVTGQIDIRGHAATEAET